jgi:sulfate adenylyltransferase
VIKPHGADALKPLLVSDERIKSELLAEANGLPSFVVSSAAAANLVMLGGGYFTPLSGFMSRDPAYARRAVLAGSGAKPHR